MRPPKVDLDWWQPVLRRLREAPVVCVDTETSGLDWRHNHIVGWVFTFSPDPQDSFYLPVRHAPGGNILDFPGPQSARGWDGSLHPIEREIIDCLDQPGKLVFGHHLAFDLKAMWRLGLQNHDAWFECTQVNAALLDEHHYSFSLEFCCEEAQVQAKKSKEIREYIRSLFPDIKTNDEMGHFWRLHGQDPMAVDYARGDGTSTWQLRDWQWPRLGEQELNRVHDVECRLLPGPRPHDLPRHPGKPGTGRRDHRRYRQRRDGAKARLPAGLQCEGPDPSKGVVDGPRHYQLGQDREGQRQAR